MLEGVPVKSSHLAYQTIEGEAVVLDIPGRIIRGFNPVGTRIWDLIDGRRTVREIGKIITEEFAVEEVQALSDVREFLGQLLSEGLISMAEF